MLLLLLLERICRSINEGLHDTNKFQYFVGKYQNNFSIRGTIDWRTFAEKNKFCLFIEEFWIIERLFLRWSVEQLRAIKNGIHQRFII